MIIDLTFSQIAAIREIMDNSNVAAMFPDTRNRIAATNAYAKINNAYIELMNSDRRDRGKR